MTSLTTVEVLGSYCALASSGLIIALYNAIALYNKGYHLSVTEFIDSSPNFQLNYHQKFLFGFYLIITKLNDKSPI